MRTADLKKGSTTDSIGALKGSRIGESGSAFLISILVLFLLTVLGLTLMVSTLTETDIATNYRWGEMAFFNADAALEYGKNVLAGIALNPPAGTVDFESVLPQPRGGASGLAMTAPPPGGCGDPTAPGCRDDQYGIIQGGLNIYIGRVLLDSNGRPLQYDFRQPTAGDIRGDLDGDGTPDIQGTATLWVRRPIEGDHDYGAPGTSSANRHDRVILTAEGTAPSYEAAGTGGGVSLRRLEMSIQLPTTGILGPGYSDATTASDQSSIVDSSAGQTTIP